MTPPFKAGVLAQEKNGFLAVGVLLAATVLSLWNLAPLSLRSPCGPRVYVFGFRVPYEFTSKNYYMFL